MSSFEEELAAIASGAGDVSAFAERYLTWDEDGEDGFSPALTISTGTMEAMSMSTREALSRYGISSARSNLDALNEVWRQRRETFARQRLARSRYLIAAEGDSWFHYPFGFDCLTYFINTPGVAVASSAAAGDMLTDMSHDGWADLLSRLVFEGRDADMLLFSGGGNDILFGPSGSAFQEMIIEDGQPDDPASYISDTFLAAVEEALGLIADMITTVRGSSPSLPIILHGYDTPFPRRTGKAIGRKFILKGITDKSLQIGILGVMIDTFYSGLREIAQEFDDVYVADIKDQVGGTDAFWFDEIHPEGRGWGNAYNALFTAIRDNVKVDFPHVSDAYVM